MPAILDTNFAAVADIRRRRMDDAARNREARQALRAGRGASPARSRGEPAGCPAPPRHRSRWLALS
jgi:hypothetical protein